MDEEEFKPCAWIPTDQQSGTIYVDWYTGHYL